MVTTSEALCLLCQQVPFSLPDPDVLCFVQWTDMLMQQFAANSLPLNSTQYVGSDTRLLRFTPGETTPTPT